MFTPSPYQEAFFDALLDGFGDIQLVAVAGSGKTKSIEEGVKRLPASLWSSTLCTAFNNHIKKELEDRQNLGLIPRGVKIQTIHGLGYSVLVRHFNPSDTRNWVDSRKYRRLTEAAWSDVELSYEDRTSDYMRVAIDATEELTRLAMLTLTDATDEGALCALVQRFGVEMPPERWAAELFALVPRILRWGREGMPTPDRQTGLTYHPKERISFDDMVYLPVSLDLALPSYRLCLIDECQDFNRCQQELLLRVRGKGRAVWVGDPHQSIYGFTGADADSFHRIQAVTKAQRLPLSVSYRCANAVIRVAQRLVPTIEPAPGAMEGAVVTVSPESLLELAANHYRANPRDPFLLLCRVNAPLIRTAFELIRRGVSARVKGRDIGGQLIRTLEEMTKLPAFDMQQFPTEADRYRNIRLAALSGREGMESQIAAIHDRVDSLIAVYEAVHLRKAGTAVYEGDLRAAINDLFAEDIHGVILSSIHKAKGLEARKVGILQPDLLPLSYARQPWQLEQERNLAYVAVTRAREELYLAGECPLLGPI
jgi:superfamily I DNA/RNA helicase